MTPDSQGNQELPDQLGGFAVCHLHSRKGRMTVRIFFKSAMIIEIGDLELSEFSSAIASSRSRSAKEVSRRENLDVGSLLLTSL